MGQFPIYLMTCNRYEETKQTLETFNQTSGLNTYPLYQVDDCSADDRIIPLAKKYGFKLVHRTEKQSGIFNALRIAVNDALEYEWVYLMANDWIWVKPFPFKVFEKVESDPDVWYFRPYGEFKERVGGVPRRRSVDDHHFGMRSKPVEWLPYTEESEIGKIHWSWLGVQRTKQCKYLIDRSRSVHHAGHQTKLISEKTVRMRENVCWHIGYERTPCFKK